MSTIKHKQNQMNIITLNIPEDQLQALYDDLTHPKLESDEYLEGYNAIEIALGMEPTELDDDDTCDGEDSDDLED
jgi:hypothetical protein